MREPTIPGDLTGMTTFQPRHAAGTPDGGRFAPAHAPESNVTLISGIDPLHNGADMQLDELVDAGVASRIPERLHEEAHHWVISNGFYEGLTYRGSGDDEVAHERLDAILSSFEAEYEL